jgi:hypothetical protein
MEALLCGLTPQEIEALKAKHGQLFVVAVSDGTSTDVDGKPTPNTYNAVCKEPTQEVIESSTEIGKKEGDIKGSMVLYNNCVLAEDARIKNSFPMKSEVLKEITARMQSYKATSKNL